MHLLNAVATSTTAKAVRVVPPKVMPDGAVKEKNEHWFASINQAGGFHVVRVRSGRSRVVKNYPKMGWRPA